MKPRYAEFFLAALEDEEVAIDIFENYVEEESGHKDYEGLNTAPAEQLVNTAGMYGRAGMMMEGNGAIRQAVAEAPSFTDAEKQGPSWLIRAYVRAALAPVLDTTSFYDEQYANYPRMGAPKPA